MSEIAIVAGAREIGWSELGDSVARVAGSLRSQGLAGRGVRVALVPGLDAESIILVHALVATGVEMVLVHPRLTKEERAFIVADSGAAVSIESPAAEVPEMLRATPWHGRAEVPAEATLAVLYTSGTTGRPKGARLSRRAFEAAARASAANLGWSSGDRWLLCMPPAHVGGLSIVIRTLLARRCVVLPDAPGAFDPERIAATIDARAVTLVSFVPTMLRRMFDARATFPANVRAILVGGAAAPASLVEESAARGVPILTTYGLTEACSQVTTQRYGTRPSLEQGSGEPVLGMRVRIADDARIEVSGDSLMTGYLGAHASPLSSDGWLRTEDFGRLDDEGRLHVLGRRQELIVTGGENVYPAEIERVLEGLAGVRACCVFGAPDATWGEIVCIAIVRAPGSSAPAASEVEAFARNSLASHKRPRRVAFVDDLPTSANGKLDRRAAIERARPLLTPLGDR